MEQQYPIIPETPANMMDKTNRSTKKWLIGFVLSFVIVAICFGIGYLIVKKKKKKKHKSEQSDQFEQSEGHQKSTQSESKIKGYHLRTKTRDGKFVYLNASEKIFPSNQENHSVMIHLDDKAETIWTLRSVGKGQFVFMTMIGRKMFSVQDGAPGTSSPWGIVYLAPINSMDRIGKDVVFFRPFKNKLVSLEPAWHGGNYVFFSISKNVIIWSDDRDTEADIDFLPVS